MIKGILFDLDGTLISMEVNFKKMLSGSFEILKRHGVPDERLNFSKKIIENLKFVEEWMKEENLDYENAFFEVENFVKEVEFESCEKSEPIESNEQNSPPIVEELSFDQTLRPQKLDDYVGQDKIKKQLRIFLDAAKKRGDALEHILLYGPPGLGKTTLANIIAKEMNVNIKTTSGPAIERVGDLGSILTNLQDGDVLFVDEIHRLNKSVEEVLYPAMEDHKLDLVVGKGPSAQALQIDLPKRQDLWTGQKL